MKNEKCKEGKKMSEGATQCKCEKCKESEMCFKWAVTRALNPVKRDSERVTKELKEQSKKYKWEGIEFPTKVKDIHIWEENNNIKVNVFGYDDDSKKILVIKMCDGCESIVLEEDQDHKFINLFLHDDNHYCVIKNLSRLVSSQFSKHKEKVHFCLKCQNGFTTNEVLKNHQKTCLQSEAQTHVYPNPGDSTKFRNFERLHDVPFFVCADFECFLEPVHLAEQDPGKSFTNKYQKHIPSGFCYTIKCMDEDIFPTKTVLRTASHEGEDMGKLFVDSLSEDLKPIYEILKSPLPMVMTESDKSQHEKTKKCYACEVVFGMVCGVNKKTKEPMIAKKCRDHCHVTGKYRGAACDKCNLRMRVPMFVPVLFHNLEGYDSHLFAKSLGLTEGDIKCIPKTDEKYISFSKNIIMVSVVDENGNVKNSCLEMRFLDSIKFMNGSLGKLTKTLGKDQFETLTSKMSHLTDESLNLLKQKGVFPYEYMTDFSKLSATSLPPKDAFYNHLIDEHISNEDYAHAQNVWNTFGCKTMRDYHDLYLSWKIGKTNHVFLEVDLEYPKDLHDLHGEYPLAPEQLKINKINKLVPNLYDKKKYVVHHENLKLYLRLDLKLTKIHRGVTFEERKFMKSYIDLNTELRKKGTTDFEKDFYKLMNNSVFGKTMENVKNRVNVKLVTNKKALNKLVKKSNYSKINEFHENLVAVHMEKTTVKFNKPIYLGMSILDLSKTLMYRFHYDYIKPKWGKQIRTIIH